MVTASIVIPINIEDDIVVARQRARAVAREIGFGMVDQSRIATAVSELARNVVRYATNGQGEVLIAELTGTGRVGLEITVRDEGPGMADVEQAMHEGHSSGTGLGLGLSGTQRLMDEMQIDSTPGKGTTITIRKWRH